MKFSVLSFFLLFFSLNLNSIMLPEFQKEINTLAEKTKSSVVSVRIVKEGYVSVIEPDFYFGYMMPEEKIYKYKFGGVGSGVVISPDGYVVTNHHVIEGADEIHVETLENNEKISYKAEYIGGDPKLDIAILKIKSRKKFPYIKFSTVPVNIGDFVIAIGYPFGFKQTYTAGIISSKNVSLKVEGRIYSDLIQTDAAINRGNSGGPLINIYGEIVGINSAIYSPSGAFAGIGFAIPSWRVKQIVDEVVYHKEVKRAWLGVSLIPTDVIMRRVMYADVPEGGIINKVYKNSPAYKAKLKRGDIITELDGDKVESDEDLVYRIYYKRPGDKVKIKYLRDGKEYSAYVELAERPTQDEIKKLEKSYTLDYDKENFAGDYTLKYNGVTFVYKNGKAYVSEIEPDSPLKGYLMEGDIIVGVNNRRIKSYSNMKTIFSEADISKGVLFDMIRNGEPFYLSIQVK